MAASTAARVLSRTLPSLLMTRDTVIGETPARTATSLMVTRAWWRRAVACLLFPTVDHLTGGTVPVSKSLAGDRLRLFPFRPVDGSNLLDKNKNPILVADDQVEQPVAIE